MTTQWRTFQTEKRYNFSSSANVSRMIKRKTVIWARHVAQKKYVTKFEWERHMGRECLRCWTISLKAVFKWLLKQAEGHNLVTILLLPEFESLWTQTRRISGSAGRESDVGGRFYSTELVWNYVNCVMIVVLWVRSQKQVSCKQLHFDATTEWRSSPVTSTGTSPSQCACTLFFLSLLYLRFSHKQTWDASLSSTYFC